MLRPLPGRGEKPRARGAAVTGRLRFVLGDQLTRGLSALSDLDPAQDVVLMVEVEEEGRYVRHHKQKIALLLSAMRHFAEGLRAEGVHVDYVALDDPANTHGFSGELARAVARHAPASVVVTEPGEWRVWRMMEGWSAALALPVEIREDDRFFCSRTGFAALSEARKTGRMEFFYREMRRRTGILMSGTGPEGEARRFNPRGRKANGRSANTRSSAPLALLRPPCPLVPAGSSPAGSDEPTPAVPDAVPTLSSWGSTARAARRRPERAFFHWPPCLIWRRICGGGSSVT